MNIYDVLSITSVILRRETHFCDVHKYKDADFSGFFMFEEQNRHEAPNVDFWETRYVLLRRVMRRYLEKICLLWHLQSGIMEVITSLSQPYWVCKRPEIGPDKGANGYAWPHGKIHGANMGPTWVLSAPDGPHVGPMSLAIRVGLWCLNKHSHSLMFPVIGQVWK